MASFFYIRNTNIGAAISGVTPRLSTMMRGSVATSITTATTASATWISVGYFATRPLAAFTLNGDVSFNLRGRETNNNANCSVGMRIYKYSAGSIGSSLGQANSAVEFTTTESARTGSVTPTSTAFANGDILVVELGIINIGSMGGNQSGIIFFDGPTAAASGDSYFTITEDVTLHRRTRNTG